MSRAFLPFLTLALTLTASEAAAGGPASAHHGRGTEGVFWFMHISDLHIGASVIEGPNATAHLDFALGEAVSVIKPRFVAATGDLCDGSILGIPTTGQTQEEWDTYQGALTKAAMTPSFYFDLPGNHDGYGDQGLNFYLQNSMQGKATGNLWSSWQVTTPVGNYRFFGLDSAGDGSGPFVEDPHFPEDQVAMLSSELGSNPEGELTFVLAHHRLSDPDNGAAVIDILTNAGGAHYLHGHVHEYEEYLEGNGAIVVNEVASLGKNDEANIAVGAVDHNGFVYRATDVGAAWPFVMITTPLAVTLRGGTEPNPYTYFVCKDRIDNPFRALVFALDPPTSVTLAIEGLAPVPMALVPGSNALWEAEVDTTSLSATILDVTVTATAGGVTRSETIAAGFTIGPCDPLPGGEGGSGGAGTGGASTGGAGTGGASAGGAGTGGASAGGASAGGASAGGASATDDVTAAGGCGCEVGGGARAEHAWAALAALAMIGRRRRREHLRRA